MRRKQERIKVDSKTRKWHDLSNEVTAFLFEWEDKLVQLGVLEEDAEKWSDVCWRGYAKLLLSTKP